MGKDFNYYNYNKGYQLTGSAATGWNSKLTGAGLALGEDTALESGDSGGKLAGGHCNHGNKGISNKARETNG